VELVLYAIPATATGLLKNSAGVGTLGVGSDGRKRPISRRARRDQRQGLCLHALRAVRIALAAGGASQVTGAVLSSAIANITLARQP